MIELSRRLPALAARSWRTWGAPWLSEGELRELQWQRLQRMLAHAFEHSPFYRRKLTAAGVRPEDVRRPEDLVHVPITAREELRGDADLVLPALRDKARRSLTSGSTGRPTVSYFDADAWLLGKYVLKLRARHACGMRPWDRLARFQETTSAPSFPQSLLPSRSFSVHAPVEEILPDVERFRPSVMYGFPGHLRLLAEAAGGRLHPKRIFTSGELLDASTRGQIEDGFGALVYDVYGCTETKEIAWQCERREGYHVNADWLILESVGASKANGAANGDGTLLVTSLYNFAMPLLRYEMGDTGALLPGRCACGRGLPLMAPSRGRSVDYFRLPDGARIAPYTLTCAIETVEGMRQYQLVQEARDRVVVNVVPDARFDDAARDRVAELLRPVLPGVGVRVRTVDEIPREASGKYRVVRSDLGAG